MIYQETYQAGGDPNKLNISGVIYTHGITPPTSLKLPLLPASLLIAIPSMK